MSDMFVVERNDMNVYRKGAHPQKMELAQTWEEAKVNDTLNAFDNHEARTPTLIVENEPLSVENHAQDCRWKIREDNTTQALTNTMGAGGNNGPLCLAYDGTDISPTLTASNAGGEQRMPDKGNFNAVIGVDAYNQASTGDVSKSLNSAATDSDHIPCVTQEYIVRRLTPRECEALQGFPCGWTDIGEWTDTKGKVHQTTDSARYKALGNSIAVGFANEQRGFWMWLIKRISAQFERSATMGSLFDGISGFPLAWATYNGPKNCLWSSEIEEFCIAVCKRHFGDEETGEEGDIYEYLKEYMG